MLPDEIKTSIGGNVSTFYNQEMDAFIIQWSDMRNYYGNDDQDFKVILLLSISPFINLTFLLALINKLASSVILEDVFF